ncbi:MAG: GTPase [Miltoncostaeaceae bacterium]|jgi:GTP-binding protein|nr:GTPase [Miltoncostaeaceae bacterium]
MPFTERAQIHVEGGRGGDGALSFRREAHKPKGGPDGGNGGRGGSVLLVADPAVTDLSRFRHAVHHKAESGRAGEGSAKHGRSGADLEVAVPLGTRVRRDGEVIAELREAGQRCPVARGGGGGVGNRAFRSSTHRAPRVTVPGEDGEGTWLQLELRLALDAVLVGLPNAGKSAVLRALTGAATTVAPYPHSTLEPAFGPLEDAAGNLYLVADLPGLAADGTPRHGASLAQMERARLILHCVDATDPEPVEDRLARARGGIAPFRPAGVNEIVVATRAEDGEVPAGALAVDVETGAGVNALRERVLAELAG